MDSTSSLAKSLRSFVALVEGLEGGEHRVVDFTTDVADDETPYASTTVEIPLLDAEEVPNGLDLSVGRSEFTGSSLVVDLHLTPLENGRRDEKTTPVSSTQRDYEDNKTSGNEQGAESQGEQDSVEASQSGGTTASDRPSDGSSGESKDTDVPAYRNPELLERVYDEHETFVEMTEALEVDVTPQTVRRHMIEYGIHQPESQTAHLLKQDGENEGGGEQKEESVPGTKKESDTPDPSNSERNHGNGKGPSNENRATDGGIPEQRRLSSLDEFDSRIDLPHGLTLSEVCETVQDSMTVHDVQHRLGLERSEVVDILENCNLQDVVIGRISEGNTRLTDEELRERLSTALGEESIGAENAVSGPK